MPNARPKKTRTTVDSNMLRESRRKPTKGIPTIPPRGRRTVKARTRTLGSEDTFEATSVPQLTFRQRIRQLSVPRIEFKLVLNSREVPVDADPRCRC